MFHRVAIRARRTDSEVARPSSALTMSNSRRPSAYQVGSYVHLLAGSGLIRFCFPQTASRISLVGRDFNCLKSDKRYDGCKACHILPHSRPKVSSLKASARDLRLFLTENPTTTPQYQRKILTFDPCYLFEPLFCLLLRDDLHRGFDRGSIALHSSVRTRQALPSCSAMCSIMSTYLNYSQLCRDGSMSFIVHIL